MGGVKDISGNKTPRVGQRNIYQVSEFLPGTTPEEKSNVKWELFVKDSQNFRTTKIIKSHLQQLLEGFTFEQNSPLHEYKLSAYVHSPDLDGLSTINITPEGSGEGFIDLIQILDFRGKPIQPPLRYGQNIILKIQTVNLLGENLHISIWENDNFISGKHTEDNKKLFETYELVDNPQGIVTTQLQLSLGMAAESEGNSVSEVFEGAQHEYYILVECNRLQTDKRINELPVEYGNADRAFNDFVTNLIKEDIIYKGENITIQGYDPINPEAGVSAQVVDGEVPNENCGEKFCIKKGDSGSIVKELNIRLAGFGGSLPTEEFTDKTEQVVMQFQRDYMKVPETGKVCGNLLRAVDDFGRKYVMPFNKIKCRCGRCPGFGRNKFSEQAQDSSIPERYRKYEYPGIHRSVYWATKAIMFYFQNQESQYGYKIGDISSGYRCNIHNSINGRTSTNHMGKALDLHIYKQSGNQRAPGPDRGANICRELFKKYSNAKIGWNGTNVFSLEPPNIAPTWVHVDVRQYELKYLKDEFFVKTAQDAEGQSLLALASSEYPDTCRCGGGFSAEAQPQTIVGEDRDFDLEDAKSGLRKIFDDHGREMAIIIERMYRWETSHFKSGQYKLTGTPGMEASGPAPYYGWDSTFFSSYPEYTPMGLIYMMEGRGLSGVGGNPQDTENAKRFVVFPSVEGAMKYLANFIIRYNGNYARWFSIQASRQRLYRQKLNGVVPRIVNTF